MSPAEVDIVLAAQVAAAYRLAKHTKKHVQDITPNVPTPIEPATANDGSGRSGCDMSRSCWARFPRALNREHKISSQPATGLGTVVTEESLLARGHCGPNLQIRRPGRASLSGPQSRARGDSCQRVRAGSVARQRVAVTVAVKTAASSERSGAEQELALTRSGPAGGHLQAHLPVVECGGA
jgi:hypothetical protein